MQQFYPIGSPSEPWGAEHRQAWFEQQQIQRTYAEEAIAKLHALPEQFSMEQYGSLSIDPQRYPLYALTGRSENPDAPWVLITGGVHGYETSGVQGAIGFLATAAADYLDRLNFLVAPCVSPWGYETINRWNPNCVDPNRSFHPDSPSEEATALLNLVASTNHEFLVHFDLHETTDTDESEFRPAMAARDGEAFDPGVIPDGFYTVGDTTNPQPEFQASIIAGVAQVTHIADADEAGDIIGSPMTQPGVINYPVDDLGLCAGITGARYTTTTEVYPDSPSASPEVCIEAQIAAVRGGLDYVLRS